MAFNYVLNEQDPSTNSPSHGTSVAGIVGAAKDNDICGVGIAYEVNLGGKDMSVLQAWNIFVMDLM